jgi:hypothetical protein
MVKYALVRHPDDKLALGVYRDVESQQEEMEIISIDEIHESNCLEERVVMVVVFFLAIIVIIVTYGT